MWGNIVRELCCGIGGDELGVGQEVALVPDVGARMVVQRDIVTAVGGVWRNVRVGIKVIKIKVGHCRGTVDV